MPSGNRRSREDDDVLSDMARELVTRQVVGEQAAKVWCSLQVQALQQRAPKPAAIVVGVMPELELPIAVMDPAGQLSLF